MHRRWGKAQVKGALLHFPRRYGEKVVHINPYLVDGDDTIVEAVRNAEVEPPRLQLGNMSVDGGNLILSPQEKTALVAEFPEAEGIVRRFYGSQEFIKGIERWCLWITDGDLPLANTIPEVRRRIEGVRNMRLTSVDPGAQALAVRPHRFREMNCAREHLILVPRVSSEDRLYIPCGLLPAETAISDLAYAMYDGPVYWLSVLSSRLHLIWISTVCGQLETRLRYSNTLGFNTFPMPKLSVQDVSTLDSHAWEIIAARDAHPGRTIAWLYDSETMPRNLQEAHQALDETIEKLYIGRSFKTDTERLEHLFKLYTLKNAESQREVVLA